MWKQKIITNKKTKKEKNKNQRNLSNWYKIHVFLMIQAHETVQFNDLSKAYNFDVGTWYIKSFKEHFFYIQIFKIELTLMAINI